MKIGINYDSPEFRSHPFDMLLQCCIMDEKQDLLQKRKFIVIPVKQQIQYNDTWNNKYQPSRTKYIQKFNEYFGKIDTKERAADVMKNFKNTMYINHPIFICDISGIAILETDKKEKKSEMLLKKIYYVDEYTLLWIDDFIKEACKMLNHQYDHNILAISNRNFQRFLNAIFTAYFIAEKKTPEQDSELYFNYVEMFNFCLGKAWNMITHLEEYDEETVLNIGKNIIATITQNYIYENSLRAGEIKGEN